MLATLLALLAAAALALTPPAVVTAQTPQPSLVATSDDALGVATVVPSGWERVGPGTYARRTTATDPTVLALAQPQKATAAQLWPQLLPRLMLEQVPPVIGTRTTDFAVWDLHHVVIDLGSARIAVDLAVAERDAMAYLVVLQTTDLETAGLHDAVFLPAVDAFRPVAPAATIPPSQLPYAVEDVTFPGGSAGVTLAGTLTAPRTPGRHPAVVLMSGSGAQDRDESLAPITSMKPFAIIADALTRAGMAVLRYDDRGVGGSTGDYAAATITDLTADGQAAVEYLRSRPDVDPAYIGVLGHSEGGIYAATMMAEDPEIAFGVALAGPAVEGVDVMIEQNLALMRSEGVPDAMIEALREPLKTAITAARDGDAATAEAALREIFGRTWDDLPADQQALVGTRDVFIERSLRQSRADLGSAWFRSLLKSNAGEDWARVAKPVLGIYGGRDVQVVASQNAPALADALEDAGNADHRVVTIADANHLFQRARTGAFSEYGELEPVFHPDVLPLLVDWVTSHAGEPPAVSPLPTGTPAPTTIPTPAASASG